MNPSKPGVSDLLASSWNDWSGFFLWVARVGLVVLALLGIGLAADWMVLRLFESRTSQLAFIGAQAANAIFFGLAYAVALTILIPKERKRIRFSFALLWISFTAISFILAVRLPVPLWQSVVIKIALFTVGAAILWVIYRRWKAAHRPSASAGESSHV